MADGFLCYNELVMFAWMLLAEIFVSLTGRTFEREGIVLDVSTSPHMRFSLESSMGAESFRFERCATNFIPIPGQVLKVSGIEGLHEFDIPVFVVTNMTCLAQRPAPPPRRVSADDIYAGRCDNRPVIVPGVVRDVFRDEIDPNTAYLLLASSGKPIYAVTQPATNLDLRTYEPFIGRSVTLSGHCEPRNRGSRRRHNRMIHFRDVSSLRLCDTGPDETSIPDISELAKLPPHELANQGRHRTSGHVLAVWGTHDMLVRTPSNGLVRVSLSSGPLPPVRSCVFVTGLPDTDLYSYTLSRASWKPIGDFPSPREPPQPLALGQLIENRNGIRKFNARHYGQTLILTGTVRSIPKAETAENRLYLECDGHVIAVDAGQNAEAFDALTIGCVVRIQAVCILLTSGTPSCGSFPHIQDMLLAVSSPSDITVLSRPSWWTPGRLLAVIGTMFLGLVGIFIWNLQLRRLSERRGRQLADERFARQESDLKIVERTRLAVELHDSMSQNLTGVSMEIRAAKRLADTDGKAMHDYLDLALKTIDSSRAELRNCIWDLRNRALEAKTFDEAIRLTIAQHLGEASAQIRFNIPRERISDDVANAFLRIIRELVTNAIRHGAATRIRIAGSLDGDTLHFSVQDDGLGFDVENAPGMGKGHFGLQGIRERIKAFNGTLTLTSSPGQGVKAVVTLPLEQTGRT